MSIQETRGGVPHVFRASVPHPAGRYHKFPGISKYLMIKTGLTQVKMYFTKADFDNNKNYIGPKNEWEGPVESKGIWMKGDGAACEVELVIFIRRN